MRKYDYGRKAGGAGDDDDDDGWYSGLNRGGSYTGGTVITEHFKQNRIAYNLAELIKLKMKGQLGAQNSYICF